MTPLVALAIEALPTIKFGVVHLINFIRESRTAMKQTGEWTAQMDADFEAGLITRASEAAYQPDQKQS